MSQFEYIKDIAKYGLENDQERLTSTLNELIDYSKKTRKTNFAIQLQSILKEGIREREAAGLAIHGSRKHLIREEDHKVRDFILEKITSDYRLSDLISTEKVKDELQFFIREHQEIEMLQTYNLPVANKILLSGPSGCGKTLASYVIAGELGKMMTIINLGAIVSSRLGETSKNLAAIFRRASREEGIIFFDEFDSLARMRDNDNDHGEMKRVVNTILQLFDFLPQNNILIAATNFGKAIDPALVRRFDMKFEFDLPRQKQIKDLIKSTLRSGSFILDTQIHLDRLIAQAEGLSYFTIQHTLITAIKRSLLEAPQKHMKNEKIEIDTKLWLEFLSEEKERNNILV